MVALLYFTSLDSLAYVLVSVFPPTPPPFPAPTHIFSFYIWILCQNSLTRELKIRVVVFVLKELFTHFEMLIVSHALQRVNGHYFFYFISFDRLLYCFGPSVR